VRNLNVPRPSGPRPGDRPRPGGGRPAPTIAPRVQPSLKQQRLGEPEKKSAPQPSGPKKIAEIPEELRGGVTPTSGNVIDLILQKQRMDLARAGASAPAEPGEEVEDEEGRAKGGKKGGVRPGAVVGRDARHKDRNLRQERRKATDLRGVGLLDDDGPALKKLRRQKRQPVGPQPRKGKVPVTLPITVRSLSEAVGVKSNELLGKLMGHGITTLNINSTLDADLAETVALEFGCEVEIKRAADAEEIILKALNTPDPPESLKPRAPVVTIMGHVDHGKTSLLDKIRQSNVVATEAGGITQVIRAWRVEHNGHPITFLDTPGHEAFTKMRARGANVTDIAVIVVAADDGVMPQTEEAIHHAKAAGVQIVVAINKVDLPNANVRKTEQQLYGLSVLPDNMGGDSPFVHTSAAKGTGIDDLLDAISLVAELKELKANPDKPARGSCLEANLSEGEGVFATLLVKDGTLRRGDVIVCGSTYGRVRAMYNDLGRAVQEAGPTVPCRITGLDEVPNADDPFYVVPDLATAREIAEKHKTKALEQSIFKRGPVTLESLSEAKITELKVILKADFRGSIEAIRKEIEKLHHEEVRVRLLEAAIGGITENDVWLALTSPDDTIILGFNVVPDDRARALAEERGVQIKQYNIIYQLTDDLRAALEGKLKPREEVVHLGRAVVRQTFKISRVGTVAGCYVTQGTIERSAKVRVIRNGVVVYPPPDRTASLDSLKRHKDDVREVREGFDCGLKIAGYDDIKVDDAIEAYRVEQVQRTLS
jgi:translation initiation factor IF-2